VLHLLNSHPDIKSYLHCLLHSSIVYSLTASVVEPWQDVTHRSNTCESRRILLIMCFSVELQLWAATACCTHTHTNIPVNAARISCIQTQ